MDNLITNPNDSSPLMDRLLCADCKLKTKLSEITAAHEKEREDLEFKIALRDTVIEYLTGQTKATGEVVEHLQELLDSFKRATFSGTTMKLTDARVQSYLEALRKEQEKNGPEAGDKEESGDKEEPSSESSDPAGNHADQGKDPNGPADANAPDAPEGNHPSDATAPTGTKQDGDTPPGEDGTGTTSEGTTRRGRPLGSTGSFMDHIPAENQVDGGIVELPEEERICPRCGSVMEQMGFKEQKSLSLVPAHFVMKRTRYVTYFCKCCKKEGKSVIKQTPMPSRFLYHCLVEPDVVAHLAIQKLKLGVPMNTLAQDFASRGIPISRQDISNYLTRAAEQYVIPVAKGIARYVMKENDVLSTDETFDIVVKGGKNEKGENIRVRITVWVYKAEKDKAKYPGTLYEHGRSRTKERLEKSIDDFSHTPVHAVSVHDLDALDEQQRDAMEITLRICEPNINNRQKSSGTQAGEGDPEETFEFDRVFEDVCDDQAEKDQWFREALAVLAKKKLLHSDGYGGYHFLFNIIDSGCHAHARAKEFRGFVSGRKLEHRKVLFEILCLHQNLFALEREYKDKGLDWEERFRERLRRSFPVLQEITRICKDHYLEAKAAGGLYWEAIRYNVNQQPYLYAFLLDGRLEITNTMSERAVKFYARVRRNSLFHMSDLGGESDCGYLTTIVTAMDWDLVPEKYLTFVLREGARIRPTDPVLLEAGDWVEPLLPHNAPDWCKVNYKPASDTTV